ncbi:hypothetical protein V6Z11_D06G031900 [Gossypium hirsutum]|uniref:Uncharacterized protein n=1 Tax=Gossypium tomentosum TaxID=34277 RepID=A0A5D2KEC5_GOSTO|nr:hypothetical protein ES332_D06G034700v1 [Gossypium tomentosum]
MSWCQIFFTIQETGNQIAMAWRLIKSSNSNQKSPLPYATGNLKDKFCY